MSGSSKSSRSPLIYLKGEELKNALQAEEQVRKEIEILYKEVERLSLINPLTELSNRRSFFADAHRALQLATRNQRKLSYIPTKEANIRHFIMTEPFFKISLELLTQENKPNTI